MFTWICPKCGREVGPSYSECPFCAELAATKPSVAAPPVPQYVPPPQPQYVPPPQPQYQPPPPAAPPPQQWAQPQPMQQQPLLQEPPPQQVYYVGVDDNKSRIPGWLAAVLACAAVALVVWGFIAYSRNGRTTVSPSAKAAAIQKAAGNPYAKFLELSGFRITEAAGKKLQVQFLAVNHGAADMADIEGVITLKVKGSDSDAPACTFKFAISSVPAFGAKEVIVNSFIQKRKFFEMPDWLFLEPVIEFSSSE